MTIDKLIARWEKCQTEPGRLAAALKVAMKGLRCETYTTRKGCRRRKERAAWCDVCIARDKIDRIAEGSR